MIGIGWMRYSSEELPGIPSDMRHAKPSGNGNSPLDYVWLEEVLRPLSRNEAGDLGCVDLANGRTFTPVFVMLGACPNALSGMQAVMYCAGSDGSVDFWWVKPEKRSLINLEWSTLNRHSSGAHKNDPGRSRVFYQPLADYFMKSAVVHGWRFGIEEVSTIIGKSAPRAFIEPEVEAGEKLCGRLYIHLLWQEDWTSNPFSRSKYIKGKIVYQRRVGAAHYFARQFEIYDGKPFIADFEERTTCQPLPEISVKELWELRLR